MIWPQSKQRRIAFVSFAVIALATMIGATTLTEADDSDTVATYDPITEGIPDLQINDSVASPDGSYVYVVGTLRGKSPGRKVTGAWSGSGDPDLFVAKYDTSGTRVVAYSEDVGVGAGGVGGSDYGNAISVDSSGNLYVTGQSYSSGGTYSKFFVRKLDSGLNSVGSPYFFSNPNGNHVDAGNDVTTSDEGGTTYAVAAGTIVNGNGDSDIKVVKLSWSGTTITDSYSASQGLQAGSGNSNDTSVKVAVQYGTISIANVPRTDYFIYVAGQKDSDVQCVNFKPDGTIIHSGHYDYAGGLDKTTGMAIAASGTNRVYVSVTADRSGGGTDAVLVSFDKRNMTLTPDASGWTGTWHSDCSPLSGTVGVVIEPTNNKPIVGGYIGSVSGTIPDYIAIPWSADALTPGTAQYFGGKYDYDIPTDMAMDGNGRIYIVGTKQSPTSVTINCPDSPCTASCLDTVGAMTNSVQAYVVSFTISGGTSVVVGSDYASSYSRIHSFGRAAATSSAVFASYDYIPAAADFNQYLANYYLY